MGVDQSKQIGDLSADEVAAKVEDFGSAYCGYKSSIIENGLDGPFILTLNTEAEAKEVVLALGITNIIHQRKLVSVILEISSSNSNQDPMRVSTPRGARESTWRLASDFFFNECVTSTPRNTMQKLFEIQGIRIDPSDLESALTKITSTEYGGYGDGVVTYDLFISYRVATDADLAEKMFYILKAKGIHAFLDKKCLAHGQPWKEGFLQGLRNSRRFLSLISQAALAKIRNFSEDHTFDNVLLEIETALRIRSLREDSSYILPLLIDTVSVIDGRVMSAKFSDFNPMTYPDSILPIIDVDSISAGMSPNTDEAVLPDSSSTANGTQQEVALSPRQDFDSASVKCRSGHAMLKVAGIPPKYQADIDGGNIASFGRGLIQSVIKKASVKAMVSASTVVSGGLIGCNTCEVKGLEKQPWFFHCDECSYDLCQFCASKSLVQSEMTADGAAETTASISGKSSGADPPKPPSTPLSSCMTTEQAQSLYTSVICKAHKKAVHAVAWSADGLRFATGSWDDTITGLFSTYDTTIKIWNSETGTMLASFDATSSVTTLAFSPTEANILASGSWDSTVRVWDVSTATVVTSNVGSSAVLCVAFSACGRKIAASYLSGGSVNVIDTNSKTVVATLAISDSSVHSLAWHPLGEDRLIAACQDGSVKMVQVSTSEVVFTHSQQYSSRECAVFSPNGVLCAAGAHNDPHVAVLDAATGELRGAVSLPHTVYSLSWSPCGRWLAAGCGDTKVHVIDTTNFTVAAVLAGHGNRIFCLQWKPLSSLSGPGSALPTPPPSASSASSVDAAADAVAACSIHSVADVRLLTASRDCTVRVWKAKC